MLEPIPVGIMIVPTLQEKCKSCTNCAVTWRRSLITGPDVQYICMVCSPPTNIYEIPPIVVCECYTESPMINQGLPRPKRPRLQS